MSHSKTLEKAINVSITFRPHHFLCALCFQGRGYSPAFVSNFQSIMTILNSTDGDQAEIRVVSQTDSICEPCPNRVEKTCLTEEKISQLDNAHAQALGVIADQIITWGAAKELIGEKISLDVFHEICKGCSWKEFGICEGVLTGFLSDKKNRD